MNFYDEGNYLIIHGGRNDTVNDSSALADTFVLDLFTLQWVEVKIYSDSPLDVYNRCGHSAMIYSKL